MSLDRRPVAGIARRVRTEVNYVRDPVPADSPPLRFVPEDESRSTMRTRPGEPVWIEDVRGEPTALDREGFELVTHPTSAVDLEEVEADARVGRRYAQECAALVGRLVGADDVVALGGPKLRFGETAVDELAPLTNARPARFPHGDVTDTSGPGLAEAMARSEGVVLGGRARWAMYNVWRPITPPPHDIPLAVCDARTLAVQDEVTVVAVTEVEGFGEIEFDTAGYLHNPGHRWCWFADMRPDEVLVFKTHDTDPQRAHRVAHTAFTDPTCPAVPRTRASVEARVLAVFG